MRRKPYSAPSSGFAALFAVVPAASASFPSMPAGPLHRPRGAGYRLARGP